MRSNTRTILDLRGGMSARSDGTHRSRRVVGPLLATIGLLGVAAEGHIIPPEKLHPVTAAYRECTFVLNLVPVGWDLVQRNTAVIGDYLTRLDAALGERFRQRCQAAMAPLNEADGADPRRTRDSVRRAVFEISTRAVARALLHRVELAVDQVPDRIAAGRHLKEARELFRAFDDALVHMDPAGYREVGSAFLAAAHAMGSDGLLALGGAPFDEVSFRDQLGRVARYVRHNYGDSFRAGPETRLLPRPTASRTYDADAHVPSGLPPGANINKQIPRPRQILNMVARGVNELDTPLIALGDMAFDSAFIFGEPARSLSISCNTCHNKSITNPQFFVPGLSARPGGIDVSSSFFAPHANNANFDPLDIPDLRGIRFTAPYGRNGRFASLREFTRNVIVNEFNGPEPDPLLLDGIIAYMNEFDFLTNPQLAPDGRLTPTASPAARRGETIFHQPFENMGGRSCASCHVPSNHFLDGRRHDIGSVNGYEPSSRDRALDTPTLLSARYTAPYFHDGRLPTLRAVNEWFNDRYRLGLTNNQLGDLTAYVETVSGGVDAYEDTVYYLDAELEEFSFFLSAYEFLQDKKKPRLAEMTFQTIAIELRNHKWELQDLAYLSVMDELAGHMDEATVASLAGNLAEVARQIRAYRALFAKNVENLK